MNDYSEYLNKPGMLGFIEEQWLKNPQIHDAQAAFVNAVIEKYDILSVIEFGCATGNLAARINPQSYVGVDANEDALVLAREKKFFGYFVKGDIRTNTHKAELVIAFALLKHFSLDELPAIMQILRRAGKYVIFDMPFSGDPIDDGTEFHHTWLNPVTFFNVDILACDDPKAIEPIYLIKGNL